MADKRMFSKSIIDSDHFLDMPVSAQCLYFHLAMRADDDGFVNCAKKIMRLLGASDDDMKLLAAKQYVIPFRSGVMVIRHWRMHNLLRPDRYKQTEYQDEMKCLVNEKGKPYALISASANQTATDGIPDGNQTATQIRLDKDSIDKKSICRELPGPSLPPAALLPLNTGEEYSISQAKIDEWTTLYPGVDVMQQIRNMRGWLIANKSKRKTEKGIERFIVNWLSKEQDKGGKIIEQPVYRGSDFFRREA